MNKPFTCPNCGVEFELWPNGDKQEWENSRGPDAHPERIRAFCLACFWEKPVYFDTGEIVEV